MSSLGPLRLARLQRRLLWALEAYEHRNVSEALSFTLLKSHSVRDKSVVWPRASP